ncbi:MULTISPECIES: DUF2960 domain-containing protein [Pseudoalteromonas]|jgi:hypothetical protein|uniref:DUF2960 domain-containing protein n=1 Tax=Pseudoalteromonas lipolytica TaxID=570156 RepID=A0AAD0WDD1_9GAMM|nr:MULTISPECIES: DUF2960 domain-containing protein [Pseudoalteromonas]AXV66352.1 DUF2960 domain-containing protein [Pseudoalteromonas donghaensis]EWH04988.1 hypothetical protein AT00_16520 [Pseudoalteromonas lipolytica SCSIO 04301]MAE01103.1 DUF2960 domain-containing protein [Pseudoalteromonas sp.]MBE0349761.1 hypothetical protein [Pseudoalteromonas lipolytica LMEB 39]MCC9660814.1 DUF2960 domain-containing protein [Pseudoalteromonas sp. MB41]|tara:strand:+ start:2181 stop:2420 length:240 start_codon:yes stop_codon:yes gene_type:complete
MARRITYTFKNQPREINFSKDKYRDMYHAIAAAEGIDLSNYLKMEQQIEMTSKGSAAVRNFRDQEFAKMGFSDIYFIKE